MAYFYIYGFTKIRIVTGGGANGRSFGLASELVVHFPHSTFAFSLSLKASCLKMEFMRLRFL